MAGHDLILDATIPWLWPPPWIFPPTLLSLLSDFDGETVPISFSFARCTIRN
jgi:hypothetical protein